MQYAEKRLLQPAGFLRRNHLPALRRTRNFAAQRMATIRAQQTTQRRALQQHACHKRRAVVVTHSYCCRSACGYLHCAISYQQDPTHRTQPFPKAITVYVLLVLLCLCALPFVSSVLIKSTAQILDDNKEIGAILPSSTRHLTVLINPCSGSKNANAVSYQCK